MPHFDKSCVVARPRECNSATDQSSATREASQAVDYAPKPSSIKELREQLRAQLTRNQSQNQETEILEKLHQVADGLPVIRDHKPALVALLACTPQRRTATPKEAEELRQLVTVIYAKDTEADRAEALYFALADPGDALICYRAIALERGISIHRKEINQ